MNYEPRPPGTYLRRDTVRRGRCDTPMIDDCQCFRPASHEGFHACSCEQYPSSRHGTTVGYSGSLFTAK